MTILHLFLFILLQSFIVFYPINKVSKYFEVSDIQMFLTMKPVGLMILGFVSKNEANTCEI